MRLQKTVRHPSGRQVLVDGHIQIKISKSGKVTIRDLGSVTTPDKLWSLLGKLGLAAQAEMNLKEGEYFLQSSSLPQWWESLLGFKLLRREELGKANRDIRYHFRDLEQAMMNRGMM